MPLETQHTPPVKAYTHTCNETSAHYAARLNFCGKSQRTSTPNVDFLLWTAVSSCTHYDSERSAGSGLQVRRRMTSKGDGTICPFQLMSGRRLSVTKTVDEGRRMTQPSVAREELEDAANSPQSMTATALFSLQRQSAKQCQGARSYNVIWNRYLESSFETYHLIKTVSDEQQPRSLLLAPPRSLTTPFAPPGPCVKSSGRRRFCKKKSAGARGRQHRSHLLIFPTTTSLPPAPVAPPKSAKEGPTIVAVFHCVAWPVGSCATYFSEA